MRARNVAVVSVAAAAGAAALGAHHLRDAPTNMRRYSMPSVGVYDLVTHLLFRGRYDEIARGDRRGSARTERRSSTSAAAPARCSFDSRSWLRRWTSRAWTSIPRWSRGQGPRRSARFRRAAGARPSSSPMPVRSPSPTRRSTSWSARTPSTTSPTAMPPGPRSSACSSPGARAIIWDVVGPHGAAGPDAHRAVSAGHHAPASAAAPVPHAAGALDVVRMLLKFGRIPAERYELVKPA